MKDKKKNYPLEYIAVGDVLTVYLSSNELVLLDEDGKVVFNNRGGKKIIIRKADPWPEELNDLLSGDSVEEIRGKHKPEINSGTISAEQQEKLERLYGEYGNPVKRVNIWSGEKRIHQFLSGSNQKPQTIQEIADNLAASQYPNSLGMTLDDESMESAPPFSEDFDPESGTEEN